ncbi:Dynein light chain 1, axonemal [Auxenochlorella protothecoides]|nr:Dynein light chain 1, axonemal [Auxenochlorella protothecoides]KFM24177.1 Dynein light chain 1, axonemal [Auxenochlorella protothecoides]RMZ53905.1 hypothetical protein APUTEX25_004748 [Auxenochlorella protothecoides]|eukprot:RMZ53905.1 hypothetical protein APUTEX25_004748 [Auxenochlorella protothecoides]
MSKQKGTAWAAMEMVNLCGACPPIERMDSSILGLKASRHLALSTNSIDKIGPLTGLSLETLSMGRNCLKRIENLEGVAPTLRQLWISYNSIEKLVGIEKAPGIRVLYASNNKIRDWLEIERLTALPDLEELLLAGNPLHSEAAAAGNLTAYRLEVLRRLPHLKKLDGIPIEVEEKEAARALPRL